MGTLINDFISIQYIITTCISTKHPPSINLHTGFSMNKATTAVPLEMEGNRLTTSMTVFRHTKQTRQNIAGLAGRKPTTTKPQKGLRMLYTLWDLSQADWLP